MLVNDEVAIPDLHTESKFTLEAFSDSSWAGCKATRRSTSSGIIFLNGSFVMSVCRTQVSVALSSCEAELYAANGLMVESIYLYRLCKFLCSDGCESNSEKVQQRLFLDSSSALGLIRRTGTGRLKHIQIKQFFLQNLLRSGIFTVHKVNTKINPGDLNTKRFGGERRSFLGRLIGLFVPGDEQRNNDNATRQIRRLNRATREQVVRLVQMAGMTMNMCLQMKGCANGGDTNGSTNNFQMMWWTLVESTTGWLLVVPHLIFAAIIWTLFLLVQVASAHCWQRWFWWWADHWFGEIFRSNAVFQYAMLRGWWASGREDSSYPVFGYLGGFWEMRSSTFMLVFGLQVRGVTWCSTSRVSFRPPDRWTNFDWCSRRRSREWRTNGGTPGGWANGRAFWPRWWHCRPGITTCKATQWSLFWITNFWHCALLISPTASSGSFIGIFSIIIVISWCCCC